MIFPEWQPSGVVQSLKFPIGSVYLCEDGKTVIRVIGVRHIDGCLYGRELLATASLAYPDWGMDGRHNHFRHLDLVEAIRPQPYGLADPLAMKMGAVKR